MRVSGSLALYPVKIEYDGTYYHAIYPDLNCRGVATSPIKALEKADREKARVLKKLQEKNKPIPDPSSDKPFL